jgi:hypothetical protein
MAVQTALLSLGSRAAVLLLGLGTVRILGLAGGGVKSAGRLGQYTQSGFFRDTGSGQEAQKRYGLPQYTSGFHLLRLAA